MSEELSLKHSIDYDDYENCDIKLRFEGNLLVSYQPLVYQEVSTFGLRINASSSFVSTVICLQ